MFSIWNMKSLNLTPTEGEEPKRTSIIPFTSDFVAGGIRTHRGEIHGTSKPNDNWTRHKALDNEAINRLWDKRNPIPLVRRKS